MTRRRDTQGKLIVGDAIAPAEPLWRVAPTRAADGRCLADFMMLIPGLATGTQGARRHVIDSIRGVCECFGESVAFAEVNYRLNILWVSVAAEPGLTGRVAAAIRQQVPTARLVGGQLGAVPTLPEPRPVWADLRARFRRLPRPGRLGLPRRRG